MYPGSEPSPSLACPDWVWSNNSNVHTAKDRVWFSEYTPFPSVVRDMFGNEVPVAGVGTVNLSVKRHPDHQRSGSRAHITIVLRDVLHIPNSICNIVGRSLGEYGVVTQGSKGCLSDSQGQIVAHFDPNHRMFAFKPSGPPRGPVVGPSAFSQDGMYVIRATWDPSERQRWEKHRPGGEQENAGASAEASADHGDSISYTAEEKAWLKKHFGNEFKFLRLHGLSIFKDDHRKDGQEILRAMMRKEEKGGDDEDDDEDRDEDDEAHAVDYIFTSEQLDFIEKNWKNSMNFMYLYGLKFYNDEDCEEAKVLVRALMTDD